MERRNILIVCHDGINSAIYADTLQAYLHKTGISERYNIRSMAIHQSNPRSGSLPWSHDTVLNADRIITVNPVAHIHVAAVLQEHGQNTPLHRIKEFHPKFGPRDEDWCEKLMLLEPRR